MPQYILIPKDLEHPDWEASVHKEPCRITAPDESAAREFADVAFRIATERRNRAEVPLSPWSNPQHVKVQTQPPSRSRAKDNFPPLIEVPDHSSAKVPIDQWKNLDDIADFDSGATWRVYPREEYLEMAVQYLRAEGHDVNNEGELQTDSQGVDNVPSFDKHSHANTVVQSIIADPGQYQFLAQSLIHFLEDVESRTLASYGENTHPIWGTLENAAELDELLREIRDELRRFNGLLTQKQRDEPSLADSTGNLRSKIKDTFAVVTDSPFGKTVQVGLGGLFVAYLYQFGLRLGLSPLEPDVAAVVSQFLPGG